MLASLLAVGLVLAPDGGASGQSKDLPELLVAWWKGGPRSALNPALEARVQESVASHGCPPPSPAEISAQADRLGDFYVLRTGDSPHTAHTMIDYITVDPIARDGGPVADGGAGESLHAWRLSAAERSDLAYLLAALGDSPRPVPWRAAKAGETRAQAERRDALQEAVHRGDLSGVLTSGRRYVAALDPVPGHAWVLPWDAAAALADLALAEEVKGDPARAAEIDRRLAPQIWCGNCAEGFARRQAEGRVRTAEAVGRCHEAIADRLRLSGSDGAAYGPKRLADAGFDVLRLYRGALLTIDRRDEAAVRRALRDVPAGLERLAREGTEDLFDWLRPLTGLPSFSGAAGVPAALNAASAGSVDVRAQGLDVLDRLLPEPMRCSRRRSQTSAGGYGESCSFPGFGTRGPFEVPVEQLKEAPAVLEASLGLLRTACADTNAPAEKCDALRQRLAGLRRSALDRDDAAWQQPGEDPYEASSRHVEAQLTPRLKDFQVVSCLPLQPPVVAAMEGSLGDFFALRWRSGALVADPLSAGERGDLAYFLTAVADEATPEPPVTARHPSSSAERQEALKAVEAGGSGGVAGLQRLARRYLELDGYPAGFASWDDGGRIGGKPALPIVARALAGMDELLGNVPEAFDLYRRLLAAETGKPFNGHNLRLMRDLVRSANMSGQCPGAMAERLFDPVQPDAAAGAQDVYGPSYLSSYGYDLPRLYRGALLTLNRDRPVEELRSALARLPKAQATAALARLTRIGPEAWEPRVRALEGLADVEGLDALPALLQAAQMAAPPDAARAIEAIAALVPSDSDVPAEGERPIHTWVWENADRRLLAEGLRKMIVRDGEVGVRIERLRAKLGLQAMNP